MSQRGLSTQARFEYLDVVEDAALEAHLDAAVAADLGAPAAILQVAGDRLDSARDELERLVDQVRAPVVEETSARLDRRPPAARRPVPHYRDLEQYGAPMSPSSSTFFTVRIVPVPAAVLEDAQQHVVAAARLDHRVGFAGVQAHHLVGDDVLPGVHRLDGERRVRVVRRREDDEVDVAVREHVAERLERGDAVLSLGLGPPLGRARDDGGELQLGHPADEVGVKAATGESVSD